MDTATTIVLIAVLLMVLAYVFQPLVAGVEQAAGQPAGAADTVRQRAALLAERNRIYSAINALDFDYSTSKIADEDYTAQRYALVAEGVAVLKHIDALPPAEDTPARDPIEAAVLALRAGHSTPALAQPSGGSRKSKLKGKQKAGGRTSFCPHCGKPVVQGDLFCAACGNRL